MIGTGQPLSNVTTLSSIEKLIGSYRGAQGAQDVLADIEIGQEKEG